MTSWATGRGRAVGIELNMPTNSQYPPVLLQEAAQFDPRVRSRLQAMQEYAGPEHAIAPVLGGIGSELKTGQAARLPEADYFAAAQGNIDAKARIAAFEAGRSKAAEYLMSGLDEAEFERFRAKKRQGPAQEPPTLLGGALDARSQLINALKQ